MMNTESFHPQSFAKATTPEVVELLSRLENETSADIAPALADCIDQVCADLETLGCTVEVLPDEGDVPGLTCLGLRVSRNGLSLEVTVFALVSAAFGDVGFANHRADVL